MAKYSEPKIYIAIPTLGNIRAELAQVLFIWAKSSKIEVKLILLVGQLPLDNARSQIVKEFLKHSSNPNDRLWFIDDDIVPPVRALDVLYDHDKDIVGALCFMMKHNDAGDLIPAPIALRLNEDNRYNVFFNGKGLTEIDAFGGGCVMIKRKVIEDIDGRLYKFHYHPDGTLKLVGDFHFCEQAKKAGYKIYVDFGCVCDHIKPVGLKQINNLLAKIKKYE